MPQTLENLFRYKSKPRGPRERGVKAPYKSTAEEIISEVLDARRIKYKYEDRVFVESRGKYDDEDKGRLWYPDFHLQDLGIIIEFMGMRDDDKYKDGSDRRRETYEKMGVKAIFIYSDEVYDENHKLRKGFKANLVKRINDKIKEKGPTSLREGMVDSNGFDYSYNSKFYHRN